MLTPENATTLQQLLTRYLEAQQKSSIAAERRSDLPAGATRAKVTTANARWMAAAEERDRALKAADAAVLAIARSQFAPPIARAHRLLVSGMDREARTELSDLLKQTYPDLDIGAK
jgi:hypothetical protein